MIWNTAVELIYKGLKEEYDDPLEELRELHENMDDCELAEAIRKKIYEMSMVAHICPDCGADLDTTKHREIHDELDRNESEYYYTYGCECGWKSC